MNNILVPVPDPLIDEHFETILSKPNIRIERIVSKGHTSPEKGWYDQDESEWVLVLQGSGVIAFENGHEKVLREGDYIDIPAHEKHRVIWTAPDELTIWLAVFY